MVDYQRKLLVIGGKGALGQALVQHFKAKNTWVASVDHGENPDADFNIVIHTASRSTAEEQADWIFKKLKDELKLDGSSTKALHGIICVAGGWTGGNIISQEFLKSVDQMWKQSVESSAVAAFLAGKLLKQDGLLVLTGAQTALNPTPSMIGYGMAKAAVHHLIKSLACEESGLSKNAVVVGLLPRTLDTPNNRKYATGEEDFGTWTPLDHISGLIEEWMEASGEQRAKNGSLMIISTKDGVTSVNIQ